MSTFLIDYENVKEGGLKGVDVLKETDTLIIFYSSNCNKIRTDYMQLITDSGCEFKIVKLKQTGKNGLDFYIAAECGIISERGEQEIAIISNDKGFKAVIDFFNVNDDDKNINIVKAANIEIAITLFSAKEDSERRSMLQHRMMQLDLSTEYSRIKAHAQFLRKIELMLQGTEYADRIQEIVEFAESKNNSDRRSIYTTSLHKFGRRDGTAIYKLVKDCI